MRRNQFDCSISKYLALSNAGYVRNDDTSQIGNAEWNGTFPTFSRRHLLLTVAIKDFRLPCKLYPLDNEQRSFSPSFIFSLVSPFFPFFLLFCSFLFFFFFFWLYFIVFFPRRKITSSQTWRSSHVISDNNRLAFVSAADRDKPRKSLASLFLIAPPSKHLRHTEENFLSDASRSSARTSTDIPKLAWFFAARRARNLLLATCK